MTRPLLEIEKVSAAYDSKRVLESISFTLARGEIGCLLGPSGCGKSTLLRVIAGFEPVSSGTVTVDGCVLSDVNAQVPPAQRQIGMVFQDFSLFPHLSVAANIGFGLRKQSRAQREQRVSSLLERIGLGTRANAMPHELSGGEQQRVALARALAPAPQLILLDEPFSSLDAELRESLGRDVRAMLKHEQTTALMVTHDQFEAFAIADQVGVVDSGQIAQWGSAYDLYHRPASSFVADFVGQGVMLPGVVSGSAAIDTALGALSVTGGGVDAARVDGRQLAENDRVKVLIRPDDIIHDDHSAQRAMVLERSFRGAEFLYTLELEGGQQVLALVPSHHDHQVGELIGIRYEIDHLVVFAGD